MNYHRLFGWALRLANPADRRDAVVDLVVSVIADQVIRIAQDRPPEIRLPPPERRLYGPSSCPTKE